MWQNYNNWLILMKHKQEFTYRQQKTNNKKKRKHGKEKAFIISQIFTSRLK